MSCKYGFMHINSLQYTQSETISCHLNKAFFLYNMSHIMFYKLEGSNLLVPFKHFLVTTYFPPDEYTIQN